MKKLPLIFCITLMLTFSFAAINKSVFAAAETTPMNLAVTKNDYGICLCWTAAQSNQSYNIYIDGVMVYQTPADVNYAVITEYLSAAGRYTLGVAEEGGTLQTVIYDHYVKYEKPYALAVDDGKIFSWEGSAERYTVFIDGIKVADGLIETLLDLSGLLTAPKTYSLQVQGEGRGFYVSSDIAKTDYKNSATLQTPTNLAVWALGDDTVFGWQRVARATGYSVTVEGDALPLPLTFETASPALPIDGIITQAGDYILSVYAEGGEGYLPSGTATYEYTKTQTIQTPDLSLEGKTVSWQFASDALSYSISVNGAVKETEYTRSSYDFSALITAAGSYVLTVQANPNGNYLQSAAAAVTYLNYEILSAPEPVLEGDCLRWAAVPNAETYTLCIDGKVYDNLLTEISFNLAEVCAEAKDYSVSIRANAIGFYLTSDAAVVSYSVFAVLATVQLELYETTVSWYAVVGAQSYTVKVDGAVIADALADTSMDLALYLTGTSHLIEVYANGRGNYLQAESASVSYMLLSQAEVRYRVELSGGEAPSVAAFNNSVYILGESGVISTDMYLDQNGYICGTDTDLLENGVSLLIRQTGEVGNPYLCLTSVCTVGGDAVIIVTQTVVYDCAGYTVLCGGTEYGVQAVLYFVYKGADYYIFYDGEEGGILLPAVANPSSLCISDIYNPDAVLYLS